MRFYFLILMLVFSLSHRAQYEYPKDVFRSPLDIPLILAGTFGELRSNHFHSGIDIKTQQRQGLPVYTISEGFVSRIKISHWGYGKVIYIAHPNGYTSVYGHLQKFSPRLETYIKRIQYEKQSYEVEVFPEYGELGISAEEIIAYSGNSGSSSGPHLHFEIRNSISERPANPLLFGLDVRDATNPTLLELYGYALGGDSRLNGIGEKLQLPIRRQQDGSFLTDTLYASGVVGFGINAYDRQDMAANKNGVYAVQQRVNGKVYADFDFDAFSFSETRYINTMIDYAHFSRFRERIQRCFKVEANRLDIYNELYNNGRLEVVEGEKYQVEIDIRDLVGNVTRVDIPVQGKILPLLKPVEAVRTPDYLVARKPNNYDLGLAKVYFPANTFYEDFYIQLQKGVDTIGIHDNSIPAHRNFTITFDVSKYSQEERRQFFIARLNERLAPEFAPTYKRGNTFTTRTRNLGRYTLVRDSVPPKIWAKNFKEKQWLNNYHYLSLHISDSMSGIDRYTAWLNGEWILLEYEPKTNTLTYNFDDKILDETACELEVIVTDNVGNSTTFTSSFFRN